MKKTRISLYFSRFLVVFFTLFSLEQLWMAWLYHQRHESYVSSICVALLCAASAFDNFRYS